MGLELVEILMETEEVFGISLPDDEAGQLATPGDLCDAVLRELRIRQSGAGPGRCVADNAEEARPAWTEEAVWAEIQRIVDGQVGIGADAIRRDAHFVRDLGCG